MQADGDGMGNYIQQQTKPRDFSRRCMEFCSISAARVKKYGGVPIYASGDDLLFLAPLTGKGGEEGETKTGEDETILDLLRGLREDFEAFWKVEGGPTLSFGLVIRYYKYPLYEAFEEVRTRLFGRAKNVDGKNAVAISLQKHSGKSAEFILGHFNQNSLTDKLIQMIRRQQNEEVLQSIRSKIWQHASLFREAMGSGGRMLKNVFDNTFDSEDIHHIKKDDIDAVRELLESLASEGSDPDPQAPDEDCAEQLDKDCKKSMDEDCAERQDKDSKERLEMLDDLLRFVKFWGERGDDSDVEAID